MDNEVYYTTLKKYYYSNIFKKYMDANKPAIESFLNNLDLSYNENDENNKLSFLDEIPYKDRENSVIQIIEWIVNFTLEPLDGKQFDKPDRAIAQEINRLIKIENELAKYLDIDIETIFKDNYGYATTYDDSVIINILKSTKRLKEDLENGKRTKGGFKYFPHQFFYKEKRVTKNDLLTILNDTAKEFNIKKQSLSIKQFVDSINSYD